MKQLFAIAIWGLFGIGSTVGCEGYLGATQNWCSLGAAFGGSFGMGRGLPNSPSAQTQQPFSCPFSHRPYTSLRKAFALNSGWLKIVSETEKCLDVVEYDVVCPPCVVLPYPACVVMSYPA